MRSDGANATLRDVFATLLPALRLFLGRRARRRGRAHAPDGDPALRARIHERMDAYWRTLGVSAETRKSWFTEALDSHEYADVVERCARVWGPLAGRRIVDFGCGWGSLSVQFAREGARMTFIDHVPAHVEVAQLRVPGGKGFVYDGRDLSPVFEQVGHDFDNVLLNSVIEHVGPPGDHRGDAASSLEAKQRVLSEAARLVRPGGGVYLSTGNYSFPLDGEIKTWFFHWLPGGEQARLLGEMGLDADRYGLLRWPELEGLAANAGLRVDRVETVEVNLVRPLLVALSFASRVAGYRLPRREIDQLVELMSTDPSFMPAWFVFLRREPSAVSPPRASSDPRGSGVLSPVA
jgi:2-polyprenyl-3-methyl-5-hydroxy-6-metoxy-1,4-benzoquinol methylase